MHPKYSQSCLKILAKDLKGLLKYASELKLQSRPSVILMAGLNGAGKTTLSGKLAFFLKTKKNRKPLLVACDVYRPAAVEQLRVLAEQIEVPIYMNLNEKDPVKIAREGIQEAKAKGYDTVIVDTAGRLAVDEELMNEIAAIKEAAQPDDTLFVVDAMTGQDAVNTAKEFNDRLDYEGVVLTKLDGDTRGGAALSIRTVVDKPIMFVGTGEKMEALDVFHPERMADRILGMGDIVSLVERAQEQFDEKEALKLQRKIQKNQFDFNDPEILNQSRRNRIAKGSGTTIQEVNRLVKQFDQTRKMMKMVTGSKMGRMMAHMPKMPGMPTMPKM